MYTTYVLAKSLFTGAFPRGRESWKKAATSFDSMSMEGLIPMYFKMGMMHMQLFRTSLRDRLSPGIKVRHPVTPRFAITAFSSHAATIGEPIPHTGQLCKLT